MKNVFVLGANADIGKKISEFFLEKNYKVLGTYHKKKPKFLGNKNIELIKCDITKTKSINKLFLNLKKKKFKWDIFFSSVGSSEPIGNFFSTNFSHWKYSANLNFISQLEVLHKIFYLRNKKKINNVIFLAGGGTNNPFTNYSAYCVSKIALIKMCELLDDENKNLNIFIIGPGFTKTKTHFETIKAGKKSGRNFHVVKKFLKSNKGTSFKDIFDCIIWGISSGKKTISGRNFSVVHDNWRKSILKKKLLKDKNMYKLRRFKN
jgi:short-subunit dehydrogenase